MKIAPNFYVSQSPDICSRPDSQSAGFEFSCQDQASEQRGGAQEGVLSQQVPAIYSERINNSMKHGLAILQLPSPHRIKLVEMTQCHF